MKSIMISLTSKITDDIINGCVYTTYIKKRPPKEKPFNVYIYNEEKDKVVGQFVCCDVHSYDANHVGEKGRIYSLYITELKIYDTPKKLNHFTNGKELCYDGWLYGIYSGGRGSKGNYDSYLNIYKIKRPPQSWCYCEVQK